MAAKNKTIETEASVKVFLQSVADEQKKSDCLQLVQLLKKETGYSEKMWGSAIIGFGNYHYQYESGREGDAPLVGFSPRTSAIVLYLSANFEKREKLLKKLGKHKTGKSCIYIKKLADIDTGILKEMVKESVADTRKKYPA